MKTKGKLIIAAVVVVLIAIAFGGYKYYSAKDEAAKAVTGQAVQVSRQNMKSVVSATGTIRPVDSVEVSSKITARIKSVLVK